MDLGFDLETSWPLDHISFPSNPLSPLLLSSSDRPCSPLWAFSDADDDRLAASSFSHAATPLSFSDYPNFLTCNPSSVTENHTENDDKRKLPSSLLGLMPIDNPDGYCIIKERMTQALRNFKESTEQHVLAQIWAPAKNGARFVLTTSGQPFVIDPRSNGLHQYRMVSLMYMFSVGGEFEGELGLPGRVFQQKLPEWTPNVQYCSSKEYLRRDHALNYNVQGTLALPVFEPSEKSCVGVLELIMTSQKINHGPEVDKVCKALEAVNFKSSKVLDHPSAQILTVVCETHKLALAQTWVPCMHRGVLAFGGGLKKSCTSFDGSCNGQVCMSTTDVAFYIVDPHMWGFREACLEHHLQKGQGVAGRAFLSHNAYFCPDITQFCKTSTHYSHTGDDDYILEFFVPPSISDTYQQKALLGSLLATMKQHFQSLKVASGMDLEEEEGFVEIIQTSMRQKAQLDLLKQQLMVNLDVVDNGGNTSLAEGSHFPTSLPENKGKKKPSKRKRGKTEKSISLEVLQQYFVGNLKDAAKSLGVCPTTMKHICRQHGISRWPSRAEGTLDLTPLTTSPLPVAVGSTYWPSNLNGYNRQHSPNSKSPEPKDEKNGSPICKAVRTGNVSREESAGTPTSHVSCQGSPTNDNAPAKDVSVSPAHEHCSEAGTIPKLAFQPKGKSNLSAAYSIPDALVATEAQAPFGEMLIEDAGMADTFLEERVPESSWTNHPGPDFPPTQAMAAVEHAMPQVTARPETKCLSTKATYREDIIRFRIFLGSGIVELKEEVAKRLKLEVGSFDIEYLDDDHEWVLIACDADLQECIDISRLSGSSLIRLSVHDVNANLGSSCESNGKF
ncbi:hypothetical protein P3X46_030160 [Hevea brasiliensis]|uniref:RWP-RK domain-containing protein n=1 Tax=Hevea brasiliensis TaxID=3981 RepID=A0ABQ9KXF9_HEVBR|nr:hypothetical protein P3X46_030160 [Hevea brasiliensis]